MRVLLGIGGSDDSIRALDRTVRRAAEAGDELTIAIFDNPDSEVTPAELERRARETIEGSTIEASVRTIEGDPGSRLLEIAETEGFEEIVLGGGNRSPMGKIQIGRVAEFVLLNAHTTVTLVR